MPTIDSAPEGGKFRAKASSGLDGTAGAWGDGNLLCVQLDGSGELAVGSATAVDGVILTSEGKRDSTHANYKKVEGGRFYTVLRFSEMVELDQWASPTVSAGDVLYAAASGDVTTTASDEAVVVGKVVQGDGTSGMKFVLDLGGTIPSGLLSGADITVTTVAGAAAGDVTVTGIATTDTLVAVVNIDIGGDAITTLTSEFTISAADTINNTGGTSSAGGVLFIIYTS